MAACAAQFAEAEGMDGLVHSIEGNTKRYQQLFAEVIDAIMPKPTEASEPDVADILAHHVRAFCLTSPITQGFECPHGSWLLPPRAASAAYTRCRQWGEMGGRISVSWTIVAIQVHSLTSSLGFAGSGP